MSDADPILDHVDADDVEAVALGPTPVPVDPDPCGPAELTPLPPSHRLHRLAELEALPGLHFDERDDPMPLRDEIDVAVAGPKATVHDLPAVALQPPFGDPLAQKPELLPSI